MPSTQRRISLLPTMQCNLSCPHCLFRGTELNKTKAWTIDDMHKVLHIIFTDENFTSCKNISILGGEPSLWPHLPLLIKSLKADGRNVQVVTNGTGKPEAFDGADIIRVTDYGAVNHWDYWKLRNLLGRKVHMLPGTHVPTKATPWAVQVKCKCYGWMFVGDMLYRCGEQARRGINGVCINDEDALRGYLKNIKNPPELPICHTCVSNKAVYNQIAPPIVAQFSVWGVEESCIIFRLWVPKISRYLYQRFRSWRGR